MKARESKEGPLPSVPVDDYFEARPLLRNIRVMERVMDWIDEDPKTRAFHSDLHCAYMAILQEELAPHALTFALAITELEDAFPEIAALVEIDRTEE
jgi:RecB family exonuclease